MVTSFGWGSSGGAQGPNSCSSCNIWEKRGEGELGDTGMVMEEEGELFVWSLGGGQMLRLMRAGFLVCVVVVVVVQCFLEAGFLTSYWVKVS